MAPDTASSRLPIPLDPEWRVDFAWKSLPSLIQIGGAVTTLRWFMPASQTYYRVPLGVIRNA